MQYNVGKATKCDLTDCVRGSGIELKKLIQPVSPKRVLFIAKL